MSRTNYPLRKIQDDAANAEVLVLMKVFGVKLSSRAMAQMMTSISIFRLLKSIFSTYSLPILPAHTIEFINYMS